LGLAITRQLALSVGGDVSLESTGSTGSTFVVHFPPPEQVPVAESENHRGALHNGSPAPKGTG